MFRRSIVAAVIAAIAIGATACADTTAPSNTCQITNGSQTCTPD